MTARRNTGLGALALAAALIGAEMAQALTLPDCRRITMVHGGEAAHRDLGEGRVLWVDWWSLEGTGRWLVIAECDTGAVLRVMTRSEMMQETIPYDRSARAFEAVEPMLASPVMRGFEQIAERLRGLRLAPEIGTLTTEPCACAALYPDLRGARPAFEMETL